MKFPPQRPTFELSEVAFGDFDARLAARQIQVRRRTEEFRRELTTQTTVITRVEGLLLFRGKEFEFEVNQYGGMKAGPRSPPALYLHVHDFSLVGLDADRLCLATELEAALPQAMPWDAATGTEYAAQNRRRDLVPMLSCGLILLLLASFIGLAIFGAYKLTQ